MQLNQLKKDVAKAVLDYISFDCILGIGSGSTIVYFIKFLSNFKNKILGVVSSSYNTTLILKKFGIKIFDINTISHPILYIDSADEVNYYREMIKGGGGALTQEKILAAMSKKFICIVDQSKLVDKLGKFPLPIEIIPSAYSYVCKKITQLGGIPIYRKNFVTDHGNIIIDVYDICIDAPKILEMKINSITGVVTVGLFSNRVADIVLISTVHGIKIIK